MHGFDSNDMQIVFESACKKYNIPENLSQFEKERRVFAEVFRTYIIPESLSKKEKMEKYSALEQFMRSSLFRYRKITDFNITALKGGYIPVVKPWRMKSANDETDSQIMIDYERIQADFSLYLSLDISYWERWAFAGKPFPDEALKCVSQDMQQVLRNSQGFLKGNLQLKPNIKKAREHIRAELAKLTPDRGTEVLDILQKTGYIACFCEDISNLDMWDEFAKNDINEEGYALEYDFSALRLNYFNPPRNRDFMILPVIYGEEYDATSLIVFTLLNGWLKRVVGTGRVGHRPLTLHDELGWIRGYFYKKERFRPEAEWRLITPIKGIAKPKIIGVDTNDDFSEVHVPPKAIYYALNIADHNFDMLDKIAVSKGLTRYRMIEDKDNGALKPEKI